MTHGHSQKNVSRRRLFWTIVFNTVITVAEFIGGMVTGYLALIADAVHNLSDVAALGLAWLGVKGAELPASKKSTYGYKRVEVMTALISAVALVVISFFIFQEAYERFVSPQPISKPFIFISVALVGLIGNLFSIWLLNSEKGKSLNMKTAFLHMAYDAISSMAVVIGGIIIMLTGWNLLDVILSVLIGLMIIYSSYIVIKEAVLIFLEAVPEGIDFDQVHNAIEAIPRVRDVHDLHIWSLSSNEIALSCHVSVNQEDYPYGPDLIVQINAMLLAKFKIGHGTIQLEIDNCHRTDVLCGPGDQHHQKLHGQNS